MKQIRDWDCGLACVSMVLQRIEPHVSVQDHETASQFYRDVHFPLLSQHVGVNLIWTIDIAWLLHHHNIPFSFSTLTLGASSDYSDIVSFLPLLLLSLFAIRDADPPIRSNRSIDQSINRSIDDLSPFMRQWCQRVRCVSINPSRRQSKRVSACNSGLSVLLSLLSIAKMKTKLKEERAKDMSQWMRSKNGSMNPITLLSS